MKTHPIIYRAIEIIPLAIFLVYAETIDLGDADEWLKPYAASSIAAILSTLIIIRLKEKLNPIFIGINLYFISGSIGLITGLTWLNTLYGHLLASGMLVWIILVGFFCLISPLLNFIGSHGHNKKLIQIYSVILLLISIIACLISYHFQSNKLLSEYLPFIVLFSTQAYFRKKSHSITKDIKIDDN